MGIYKYLLTRTDRQFSGNDIQNLEFYSGSGGFAQDLAHFELLASTVDDEQSCPEKSSGSFQNIFLKKFS